MFSLAKATYFILYFVSLQMSNGILLVVAVNQVISRGKELPKKTLLLGLPRKRCCSKVSTQLYFQNVMCLTITYLKILNVLTQGDSKWQTVS